MRWILAALLLLTSPATAGAQGMRASYEVLAAGMVVMELAARIDMTETAYSVETTIRTRGIAAIFASAEQATRASGVFGAGLARPAGFVSEGIFRGQARRIALEWQAGDPRILELVPPETDERDPVPEAERRGTMDVLSLFAALGRQVAQVGHCDATAPLFDGRRRSDMTTTGRQMDRIAPWRGAWHGDALRCDYEGRQVAGFRRDQDREQAMRPQRGTAWIAAPYPGAPSVPVRMDIPTRWFGTVTAVLLRAEPVERRVQLGR
jgi:hypothetical protein